MLLLTACNSAKQTPSLQPVALPDISRAAEPVQKQIRDRYQSLQAAIDRKAPPSELAPAFGEMGKLFMAAEYYDAAEVCLRNAQQLDAANMRWPYFLGHVFRYRSDPANAARFFEQALAHAPQDVPSLVWLADMNLAENKPDAAVEPLRKAQTLDPSSGAVLYGLGRVALAKQDYAQAVKSLEGALAISPQSTRLHYPLALAYRGLGNREKAEEHLRLRGEVDLPPTDPLLREVSSLLQNADAYEARASQALGARQWAEAATNLRKAIELSPGNAFSRLNLGTALYMQGDADAALEQYREAVRLSPTLARGPFRDRCAHGVARTGRRGNQGLQCGDRQRCELRRAAIQSCKRTASRWTRAGIARAVCRGVAPGSRRVAGELRICDGPGAARPLPGGTSLASKRR